MSAVDDQRRMARENRRLGRQLSYARAPIRALCGPLLPIFAPRDRGVRSSNGRLHGALLTADLLQLSTGEFGVGIGRLISSTP